MVTCCADVLMCFVSTLETRGGNDDGLLLGRGSKELIGWFEMLRRNKLADSIFTHYNWKGFK